MLEGRPNLDLTLRGIPAGEPVILLAHEPDFANVAARYPIALQLSGHSHGGQIWLPVIGAPWLPALGRLYPRGLRRIGNLSLYTNIGLGTIRVPVRLNCPPEITYGQTRRGRNPEDVTFCFPAGHLQQLLEGALPWVLRSDSFSAYLNKHQSARNPSFQPIFLPSS